jgi:hypothetical protein
MPRAVRIKLSLLSQWMIEYPHCARERFPAAQAQRRNFRCSSGQEMDFLWRRTCEGDARTGIQIRTLVNNYYLIHIFHL